MRKLDFAGLSNNLVSLLVFENDKYYPRKPKITEKIRIRWLLCWFGGGGGMEGI